MNRWFKAIVAGIASTLAIVATYVWIPKDPDFAGSVFGWNLTFYLPMLALSFACWVAALVFYIGFLRQNENRSGIKIASPVLLFIPFVYEVACNIALIVRLQR